MSKSILVVDDTRSMRAMVASVLQGAGYEVEEAGDGVEALERVRDRSPGLVILDLFMPGMDGAEFRRRQLADPQIAPIPVVVVSAAASLEERVAEMRTAGHLEKPIRLEDLLALVERFCG